MVFFQDSKDLGRLFNAEAKATPTAQTAEISQAQIMTLKETLKALSQQDPSMSSV